ncbi:endophilin-B2 isoform X9 [Monodelphis domestica]|uniref:endophilin-B2 isoform X9 n=1 Tax=Monodelphis domestica TaxID=13616 RepID=UPI0024E26065|nr:endophilin-B2 isoform X9 [Monodelphis domestica]
MDFNMKKLASDAGIFFTRAVQFTEEKFGQAEKTELDAHFENLLARADSTKNWTEKILRQTEVLLQPNPSARVEEFLYEKLDRKVPSRVTNGELLAQYMTEAANELGPETPYGKTLIKVGETEKCLGAAERDFIHSASINFLTPLRNFLEGDWRTISKERRILQNRRLDLDACKARLKKAKAAEAKAATIPRPTGYLYSEGPGEHSRSGTPKRIKPSGFPPFPSCALNLTWVGLNHNQEEEVRGLRGSARMSPIRPKLEGEGSGSGLPTCIGAISFEPAGSLKGAVCSAMVALAQSIGHPQTRLPPYQRISLFHCPSLPTHGSLPKCHL